MMPGRRPAGGGLIVTRTPGPPGWSGSSPGDRPRDRRPCFTNMGANGMERRKACRELTHLPPTGRDASASRPSCIASWCRSAVVCPEHGTWFAPACQPGWSRRGLTGAATAFVVPLALCQSLVRNLGRDQVQGPRCPTGSPMTPPSRSSCGWRRRTPSSSCASARRAAATTASLAVEGRPTGPVRADPPPKTIRTTTATTTITPAAQGPDQPGTRRRLPDPKIEPQLGARQQPAAEPSAGVGGRARRVLASRVQVCVARYGSGNVVSACGVVLRGPGPGFGGAAEGDFEALGFDLADGRPILRRVAAWRS